MEDREYNPGDKAFMPYADATFTAVWTCAKHRWDAGKVTTDPTCTKEGVKTFTCLNCGETKKEKVASTGHNWNGGTVTRQRDCGHSEEITYTCTACGETRTESGAAATGQHTYGAATYTWEADHSGCFASKTCSVCNSEIHEDATVTSQITLQPSGSTPGEKTFTATFSGNNGFTTQTDTVEILIDDNLYYRKQTITTSQPYVAVENGTIKIQLVGDDVNNEPVTAWLDDLAGNLVVWYEGQYERLYDYNDDPDNDLSTPPPFDGMTMGQLLLNHVYEIEYTLDPNFPGNSNDYQDPPFQLVFYR